MGKLIYSMLTSLDGYVADRQGNFDWAMPSEQVLSVINAETVSIGTYRYGGRMYELMQVWETGPSIADQSPGSQTYAELWQEADKIVYSTRLAEVTTARTKLRHAYEPDEVGQLKLTLRQIYLWMIQPWLPQRCSIVWSIGSIRSSVRS